MRLGTVSSAILRAAPNAFIPIWHCHGKRKPAVPPLLSGGRRTGCEAGEQLKRDRNGCIGAPAEMQRRQSAFIFHGAWDRK